MDRGLNELLKWGIENSTTTENDSSAGPPINRGLDPDVLSAILGGPSDADLMKLSMEAVLSTDPEVTLDDKLVAFDNFEQLIESLDNANNLEPLALWTPLLSCLKNEEAEIRRMAAWCVGTAVQNNEKSQERLFAMGGIPPLVDLATREAEGEAVKRKAFYALSSAARNYQPAMNELVKELNKLGKEIGSVDAADMEACDEVIAKLKEPLKTA
ncbi:hypothetical protein B7463_g4099, partial [Scytalidium lignicola]